MPLTPSPIDQLYFSIYGEMPTKAGVAYERLAAAICKLMAPQNPVFQDKRVRGEISRSLYQIDVKLVIALLCGNWHRLLHHAISTGREWIPIEAAKALLYFNLAP
jgi:hypothetical protein